MTTLHIEVEIQNEANYAVDADSLCDAVRLTVQQHADRLPGDGEAGYAVTVVIDDDEAVAELNMQFRGVAAPTDVLSFPGDNLPFEIPDEPYYLGDLIIAFPYTTEQAAREGHNLRHSLMLLAVHGTLHLLGYDHATPDERAAMWQVQDRALAALGVPSHIVPALEKYIDTDMHDHDDA